MTKKRDKKYDINLTKHFKLKNELIKEDPSWLGHKKKCSIIDYELLKGATKEQLVSRSGRQLSGVIGHLYHLKKEHGLGIVQDGDKFRFE